MATYFHGNSEIQGGGDGLQTLILTNSAYVGYSDNQPQLPPPSSNFLFLNSNSSRNTLNLSHAPPAQTQHFVSIPGLQGTTTSVSTASPLDSQQQDVSELHGFLPRIHYNLYNPPIDIGAERVVTRAQHGLSLSLSSQQPQRYGSFRQETEAQSQPLVTAESLPRGEDTRVSWGSPSPASGVSNGAYGLQSVLLSSKYLKTAQGLLDEVVNVEKGSKNATESAKGENEQPKNIGESSAVAAAIPGGDGQSGGEGSAKHGAELTTTEKQEIQMKKAKLVNMLDEVEEKYRQYHHQMQIVISWFEQAAGIGSAKTYTSLALNTISKQFRCLKNAILGQIQVATKNLGEEDNLGGKIEGSRLKYVDNQFRRQRALQHLGMIQHNAWRTQRGLPERSVSVLRAWLFEHFLHPYPKDSDKLVLAKQAGLTRSQVSNWFINARVRLWKPMVEEIYTEEMKENERNGSEDRKTSKSEQNEDSTLKSIAPQAKIPGSENQNKSFISKKQDNPINQNNADFNLIGSPKMESITQNSQKKPRHANMLHSPSSIPSMNMDSKPPTDPDNEQTSMKFSNERQSQDGFRSMGLPKNFIGGFGSHPIEELGRFGKEQFQAPPYSGNGISLTLGLPHCENLSMPGAHQSFISNPSIQLGRSNEIGEANDFNGMNTSTSTHSPNVYGNINIENRKRFAAQLLPDFVVD